MGDRVLLQLRSDGSSGSVALSRIVPSSMRFAQTLPDGRNVFLARVHIPRSVSLRCAC